MQHHPILLDGVKIIVDSNAVVWCCRVFNKVIKWLQHVGAYIVWPKYAARCWRQCLMEIDIIQCSNQMSQLVWFSNVVWCRTNMLDSFGLEGYYHIVLEWISFYHQLSCIVIFLKQIYVVHVLFNSKVPKQHLALISWVLRKVSNKSLLFF